MILLIDLHTHILPEIDDGSRSVEMSLKLLQMEQKQKAGTVVLTPHFIHGGISRIIFLRKESMPGQGFRLNSRRRDHGFTEARSLPGLMVFLIPGRCLISGLPEQICFW